MATKRLSPLPLYPQDEQDFLFSSCRLCSGDNRSCSSCSFGAVLHPGHMRPGFLARLMCAKSAKSWYPSCVCSQ